MALTVTSVNVQEDLLELTVKKVRNYLFNDVQMNRFMSQLELLNDFLTL
jgi:hypothetical protein